MYTYMYTMRVKYLKIILILSKIDFCPPKIVPSVFISNKFMGRYHKSYVAIIVLCKYDIQFRDDIDTVIILYS